MHDHHDHIFPKRIVYIYMHMAWNTPDVAWIVGKAAMVCGYCWELRVLFGFCTEGFLTKCTLCIACVCMYTLLTQGMVLGIICTHVDLHGLMPITFNLVQRGWDRGSIKGRFEVYLYVWLENC